MEKLHGSFEGERRRIGAYYPVQYQVVACLEEESYRLRQGWAQVAPVLRVNLLDCGGDAFG